MRNVGIIILAAGASSRMGKPKQLLSVNGQPLLLHVIDQALSTSVENVVVVLGSQADLHEGLLESYPVYVTKNESWSNGIGSSIKAGLKAMQKVAPSVDAVMYMVADQPEISFEYLCEVIDRYHETQLPIVASRYSSTLGVPVLFDKSEFKGILELKDEHGAKPLILKNMERVMAVDCPEGELDLDTPEDYESFRRKFHLM